MELGVETVTKYMPPERCPAYGQTCYTCKKLNHFAACCNNARKISGVHKAEESDENFDILGISICGVTGDIRADWMVHGKIAGQEIQFKVDTGSQANLLPLTLFNRIAHASTPRKSAAVLTAYSGSAIKHVGVATEDLESRDSSFVKAFAMSESLRGAVTSTMKMTPKRKTLEEQFDDGQLLDRDDPDLHYEYIMKDF
ncbi:hypothetical protein MRX96_025792 [Rhipicephalus microplus]